MFCLWSDQLKLNTDMENNNKKYMDDYLAKNYLWKQETEHETSKPEYVTKLYKRCAIEDSLGNKKAHVVWNRRITHLGLSSVTHVTVW